MRGPIRRMPYGPVVPTEGTERTVLLMMEQNDSMNQLKLRRLRTALINWYPFPRGERALVLGENVEPLVPLLEEHCQSVDLIRSKTVLKQDLSAVNAAYDCIVAADLIEKTQDVPALLRELYSLLSDDGVFLLAFRNRFALKYLCGGTDEFVKMPFSTLEPEREAPRLYARREMEELLGAAGFELTKCYFLMPDADFVQAVYTEDLLPIDSIRDRIIPLDLHDSPLIAWEGDLYDDMVREGTLPDRCAVYMAECRKPGAALPARQVIYAALSTDRGEEHGFATVLYSNDTVTKIPLYPAGQRSLETIYANIMTLKEKGIPTVPHRLLDGKIEMPLVREEGLLVHLRRLLFADPEAFLEVFDRIYQDVLASAPEAAALPDDLSEIWGADADELNPVLERAWIDMIPYNAFWAEGRPLYYDQEFMVEQCPAKYVLFRALLYTWIHIPDAEKIIPLETAKERFGLTGLWEGFACREERFVKENRDWDGLRFIYEHCHPDRTAMAGRRGTLDPAAGLRDVHAVQLESLKELDRVCRANGLRYMAVHGTLLGAVRHHGFIPWDDDVDVAMPRKDYDRLLKLAEEHVFSPGFFLQTPRNNYGCYYGGYSKLRRDGTLAMEVKRRGIPANGSHMGIWIDIMPLDACPENEDRRRRVQNRLGFLQRIIYAKAYAPHQFVPDGVSGLTVSLYYLLAKCTRRRRLVQRFDAICRKQPLSSLRTILACYYGSGKNKNVWSAEAVESVIEMPFEDMTIPVPAGWDELLRARYGDNYMTVPPMSKRYRHGEYIFIP